MALPETHDQLDWRAGEPWQNAGGPCSYAPVSPAQRGLWLLHQVHPDSPFYNLASEIELRGSVDSRALRLSLNAIVSRHEMLRTTFVVRSGEPWQCVHPPVPAAFNELDLRPLPCFERRVRAQEVSSAEAIFPFDLSRLPLLRVTLISLSDDEHLLVLSRHHIVSDGRSMAVFCEELNAFYAGFANGAVVSLPPLRAQYADFSRWHLAWLQSEDRETQLAYWRQQLAGLPNLQELPADYPRPRRRNYVGATRSFLLNEQLSLRLIDFARAQGATPYMVMLAVFQILLHRYAGQRDIAVGSSIDSRSRVEFELLIGFLINTVVIRTRIPGDPDFLEVLTQVRQIVLSAYDNKELPFDTLVAELAPARDTAQLPLFQIEFVYQSGSPAINRLLGLPTKARGLDTGAVRSDLALCVDQSDERFWIRAEYATELFRESTIARLMGGFELLLRQVLENPRRRISALPLLTEAERRELLLERNRTHRAGIPSSLQQWFKRRQGETPGAAAVSMCGNSGETVVLSYAELYRRADVLTATLQRAGVGPGAFVALAMPRCIDLVVALLAIIKTGAAFVPLEPEFPAPRLRLLLEDCGAVALIADPSVWGLFEGCGLPRISPQTDITDPQPMASCEACEADPDDPAYIMYTSGSTGRPKGVVITGRGICNRIHWMLEEFSFLPGDRVLQKTPYSFDASVWELLAPLLVGGCVVLAEPGGHRDPRYLVRTMIAERITILQVVPSLLEMLVEERELSRCVHLRQVFCAGEVLASSLAARLRERLPVELCNTYGPTEASIDVTYWRCGAGQESAGVPIGRPISNMRAYVLDAELNPVPVGVVGELYVAGSGLARGYVNQPGQTAERFLPCPFGTPGERMYRTGDLARWRADGPLEFAGRADAQLKIRGVRIEPGEIEAVLKTHPEILHLVVVAGKASGGAVRLTAFFVPKSGVTPDSAELLHYAAARLPSFMTPSRLLPLSAMPLTSTGKPDRQELARMAAQQTLPARRDTPAAGSDDARFIQLWQEVLGVDDIGVEDSFFALGGHSLVAVKLLSALKDRLGLELSFAEFFSDPTVAGMRRRAGPLSAAGEGIGKAALEETGTLSYAQQRLWFLDRWAPNRGLYNVSEAFRLHGQIDVAKLGSSLAAIIRRHDTLRTRFVAQDGQPRAIVEDAVAFSIEQVDACGPNAESRASELGREQARRPFNLGLAPLLRVLLVRVAEQVHILTLTLHHIISDAWSLGVLLRELSAHYEAHLSGRQAELPELPIQFGDYAAWQRRRVESGRLAEGLEYWRRQLSGVSTLELVSDRPRPAVQTYEGALLSQALPTEVREGLERLSRVEHVTMFMLMAAAFEVLLHRYTGSGDVAIGTVISNRQRAEVDNLIGMFVHTLVLRSDLTGDPAFVDVLRRMRQTALAAYAHQEVPFERIVEEVAPARDLSHTPLFQVMFVHQRGLEGELELRGVRVEPVGADNGGAKFDLTVVVTEAQDWLAVTAEYNRALFDEATVERLVAHYGNLLGDIVRRPEARISELALLSAGEREELIAGWRGGARPAVLEEGGLVGGFARAASQHGSRVALQCGAERLTYAELDQASNRLARYLRQKGVGPEVCVGLCVDVSCELVVAILAILKAGGAYVALDPALPADRLSYALSATRCGILLVSEPDSSSRMTPFGIPVVGLKMFRRDLLAYSTETISTDVPRSSLLYAILTSGSTGEPKAAGAEHGGFGNLVQWYSCFDFSPATRTLIMSSPAFDLTQKNLFTPLLTGGKVHFPARGHSDQRANCDLIGREGITVLNCTPSAFYSLLEAAERGFYANLRSLHHVFLGGEPIALSRLRPWLENPNCRARIFNTYGPTECTDVVSCFQVHPSALADNTNVPIGWPLPNTALSVLDGRLEPVPVNVEGELCIHGLAVGRGYLNDAALTASRFCPDPFASAPGTRLYRTGDRVRRRRDGRLEFLGRSDRQLKVRGFRIEPGEIENALERHPAVRRAAVTAWEKGRDDVRLVAYVVKVDGTRIPARELRTYLCEQLPHFMIPSAFIPTEALPLTASGKMDYRRLPLPADEHWARDEDPAPPRTETECQLAVIWSSLLGIGGLSTTDDFFSIGGHSLLALQLTSRVTGTFGFEIPLPVIFERSTIAALADYIDATLVAAGSSTGIACDGSGDIEEERI